MEKSGPELKHWKSYLLSIPEYYQKSSVRVKDLKKLLPTMKAFHSLFYIFKHSTGLVRDLLPALVVISPYTMTVERIVSIYNILY